MAFLCINCSNTIDDTYCEICRNEQAHEKEFCNNCCRKLEVTVDANSGSQSSLVDSKANMLFQTRNITGRILDDDDDIIANRQRSDSEGSHTYWTYVFFIVFVLVFMVVVYT